MEIVVTTPHGDADIRLRHPRATTTLAEIVVAATGQAAPAVVSVDGRTIEAASTLDRASLHRGSVIDTTTGSPAPGSATLATLAQVAGPGAGRRHPLASGRHRLGPGRRANAAELGSAPVEDPVVMIDVEIDGSVTLHPIDAHRLVVGGSPVDGPVRWSGDVAVVDDRAFVIEHGMPTADHTVGNGDDPGPDGRIAFRRRPRTTAMTERRPAIDAVHDATTLAPGLWQRRPADPGAFVVPIGVSTPSSPVVVSVDLAANTIVSVAGARRASLVRAMLLEATTLHGPADLDVAVATTPTGLEEWDWAKWLPHVTTTARPAILRDAREVAAWQDAIVEYDRPHLTVLVIDGPDLWQRRDSPLHDLVTRPPEHLRVVALSATTADAPPGATILLTDDGDQRWRRVSTTAAGHDEHFLAALVETDVARRAAIAMAPLDDQEAPARLPAPDAERRTLRSIVAPPARSAERQAEDEILDEIGTGAVVVGADHEAGRTATILALRRCLARPCWLLDLLGSPWTAGLAGLDRYCDTDLDSASVDPDRLLARLRHHLAAGSDEVVVLVDGDRDAGARMIAAAPELRAVTVLAAASTEPVHATLPVVRVERRDARRRATIDLRDGGGERTIVLDDDPDDGALSVRAFVSGRALTTLERRIEREATGHPEAFVEQCRDLVAECTSRTDARAPVLARPPLPAPLHTGSLFARAPGDGIPIGIVDDPGDDRDVLWWQPDHGHLVAIGAGLGGVLDTVANGLADRYGDEEVVLLDVSAIAAADAVDDTAISAVFEHLERAAQIDPEDRALLVVVIDDLGALRRRSREIAHRLDAAATSGRLAVVGLAATLDDAGPVVDHERTTLLVAAPGGVPGRCRLAPDGLAVQLADADPSPTDDESTGSTP